MPPKTYSINVQDGSDLSEESLLTSLKSIHSSEAQSHNLKLFNRNIPKTLFLASIRNDFLFDSDLYQDLHSLVS